MDKYEYKVRADEIKALIAEGDYSQAADIADTIDWRRVKSVLMLCTVGDLYKMTRRYEDAKNLLLLAYEKRPGGRTICYSLCELCIKTEEYVQALKYYNEFVHTSPKDPGRYILQYKLYEAQEVRLEERIAVLEELKKRDYREKWAYELAFLYHRVGLATRCVEECDEMILWFGEGKYVSRAMELKMLHQPLTSAQQAVYDRRFDAPWEPSSEEAQDEYTEAAEQGGREEEQGAEEPLPGAAREVSAAERGGEPVEEVEIQVKTVDVGKYNTINLQAELAEGLREVLAADAIVFPDVMSVPESSGSQMSEPETVPAEYQVQEEQPVESAEYQVHGEQSVEPARYQAQEEQFIEPARYQTQEEQPVEPARYQTQEEQPVEPAEYQAQEERPVEPEESQMPPAPAAAGRGEAQLLSPHLSKELAEVLSQEADGQIRLVVPEHIRIEKQLTGQMKIEDVLAEWDRMKRENEERCREEVRQRVRQETGSMFTEFEAAIRDGLLEKLESGIDLKDLGIAMPAERAEGSGDIALSGETDDPEDAALPGETEEQEDAARMEETAGDEDAPYWGTVPGADALPGEEPAETVWTEAMEAAWEDVMAEDEGMEPLADAETCREDVPAGSETDEEAGLDAPVEPEMPVEPDTNEEASQDVPVKSDTDEETSQDAPVGSEADAEADSAWQPADSEDVEEEAGAETETEDAFQEGSDAEGAGQPEDEPAGRQAEAFGRIHAGRGPAKTRGLTREEKELYASFIQSRRCREQLVKAIDNISMAAYTGNVVITGEEGLDTFALAKNIICEVRMMDSNFIGAEECTTGQELSAAYMGKALAHVNNGALIVRKASGMSDEAAAALHRQLQQESLGVVVVLEDTRKAMDKLFARIPGLAESFTARIDLEALSNDTLVNFGRFYAREREHAIDELGILALHTRIEELQTIDHVVTMVDVKGIVDAAIRRASRKTLGHFFDILFARRYDAEDMVILTEKDFVA